MSPLPLHTAGEDCREAVKGVVGQQEEVCAVSVAGVQWWLLHVDTSSAHPARPAAGAFWSGEVAQRPCCADIVLGLRLLVCAILSCTTAPACTAGAAGGKVAGDRPGAEARYEHRKRLLPAVPGWSHGKMLWRDVHTTASTCLRAVSCAAASQCVRPRVTWRLLCRTAPQLLMTPPGSCRRRWHSW